MAKGNTNSGAGGSNKSTIIVTAPTGSTVYIQSQDGKRKDAGEKNGVWTFKGCDIGTWMVHASLGDQSTTSTVEITEEGQLMRYNVTITYFTATIQVTYPAGSVCTCTKGGIVLTAPDTTGDVIFIVSEDGTWVVAISDASGITSSKSIKISYSGEVKKLNIDYTLVLYDGSLGEAGENGANVMAENTGGWEFRELPLTSSLEGEIPSYSYNADGVTMTLPVTKNDTSCVWHPVRKIDLTNYKTLRVTFGAGTVVNDPSHIQINSDFGNTTHENRVAAVSISAGSHKKSIAEGTQFTLDIQSLQGIHYVAIVPYGQKYDSRTTTLVVRKVWLD